VPIYEIDIDFHFRRSILGFVVGSASAISTIQ